MNKYEAAQSFVDAQVRLRVVAVQSEDSNQPTVINIRIGAQSIRVFTDPSLQTCAFKPNKQCALLQEVKRLSSAAQRHASRLKPRPRLSGHWAGLQGGFIINTIRYRSISL